jgi:tRNA modification GTPase
MNLFDTIAAVSSPRGKGGVALLRVSGSDALAIAEKVFAPKNKKRLSELDAGRMVYGDIYDADGKDRIDDGMAVVFRAPHSFTGEDTVEITCHGGLLVTEAVLSALLSAGARAAEAGEFTRRAFAAGKMGLSAAEALGSLLEAKTHAALKLSRAGLDGRLEAKTGELFSELLSVTSALYAAIDYPEEDLAELPRDEAREKIASILSRVRALADTYKSGHAVAEGIRTVICGKPNVGKSSLFNALVGRDAAIVTDVAGTTRDILEQTAVLGKVTLRLYDTAGLHESGDTVEKIGIERARAALEGAELVLAVFDASAPLDEEDKELCRLLSAQPMTKFALLNKTDKAAVLSEKDFEGFDRVLSLSAKEGTGLSLLTRTVEDAFFDGSLSLCEDAIVANARQHAALARCVTVLESALEAFDMGLAEDICCSCLEAALSGLGEVDGREVSEQIVGEIFSKFCVGK